MEIKFEHQLVRLSLIMGLLITLSACVVAPPQPIGYRMTSTVMPTYVDGQYVGSQPGAGPGGDYAYDQTPPVTPSSSVVYVQRPTPTYTYSPYYSPTYIDPWYGVGLGLGVGVGINYYGGRCCWRGGWGGRGRGGWRHR